MCLHTCLCVYLSVCPPVSLSTCLSVHLSVRPICIPVYLSIRPLCLLVYLSTCLPVYLYTCLPVYSSICLPVSSTCLSVYLSICLPVYLSLCYLSVARLSRLSTCLDSWDHVLLMSQSVLKSYLFDIKLLIPHFRYGTVESHSLIW